MIFFSLYFLYIINCLVFSIEFLSLFTGIKQGKDTMLTLLILVTLIGVWTLAIAFVFAMCGCCTRCKECGKGVCGIMLNVFAAGILVFMLSYLCMRSVSFMFTIGVL